MILKISCPSCSKVYKLNDPLPPEGKKYRCTCGTVLVVTYPQEVRDLLTRRRQPAPDFSAGPPPTGGIDASPGDRGPLELHEGTRPVGRNRGLVGEKGGDRGGSDDAVVDPPGSDLVTPSDPAPLEAALRSETPAVGEEPVESADAGDEEISLEDPPMEEELPSVDGSIDDVVEPVVPAPGEEPSPSSSPDAEDRDDDGTSGAEVPSEPVDECPDCGESNPLGSSHCLRCGRGLAGSEPNAERTRDGGVLMGQESRAEPRTSTLSARCCTVCSRAGFRPTASDVRHFVSPRFPSPSTSLSWLASTMRPSVHRAQARSRMPFTTH